MRHAHTDVRADFTHDHAGEPGHVHGRCRETESWGVCDDLTAPGTDRCDVHGGPNLCGHAIGRPHPANCADGDLDADEDDEDWRRDLEDWLTL